MGAGPPLAGGIPKGPPGGARLGRRSVSEGAFLDLAMGGLWRPMSLPAFSLRFHARLPKAHRQPTKRTNGKAEVSLIGNWFMSVDATVDLATL